MGKAYYTGIGSRNTPHEILKIMEDLAFDLANKGLVLRSGGADGADTAFERGCCAANGEKEIYLPWKGFNDNPSHLYNISNEAMGLAEVMYGNRWPYVKPAVKKLMARNMYQVTGETLKVPSLFVVCWTPDGCETGKERSKETGGTGQAIQYASTISTPVYNLAKPESLENLKKLIDVLGVIEW